MQPNVANSECERFRTCEHKFDTAGQTIHNINVFPTASCGLVAVTLEPLLTP